MRNFKVLRKEILKKRPSFTKKAKTKKSPKPKWTFNSNVSSTCTCRFLEYKFHCEILIFMLTVLRRELAHCLENYLGHFVRSEHQKHLSSASFDWSYPILYSKYTNKHCIHKHTQAPTIFSCSSLIPTCNPFYPKSAFL